MRQEPPAPEVMRAERKIMILHFEGEGTSEIEITKDGKKWMYFTALSNHCKYRLNKQNGKVQIAPYWYDTKIYID
jgi:hypothetical protein